MIKQIEEVRAILKVHQGRPTSLIRWLSTGESYADIWQQNVPGRRRNTYRAQEMGACLYCLRNGKEDTGGSIVRDPDRQSGVESKTLKAMLSTGFYSVSYGRSWRVLSQVMTQSDLSLKISFWLLHWKFYCKGTREKSRRPFRRLLQ